MVLVHLLPMQASAEMPVLRHEFEVTLHHAKGEARVNDRIILPAGVTELVLTGRARDLSWDAPDLRRAAAPGQTRLMLENGDGRRLELTYTLPLDNGRTGSADDGVVWDGNDPWYAATPGTLLSFTLDTTTPASWRVISQGARLRSETVDGTRRETWRETRPQQEIYLIAAPFTEYLQQGEDSLQFMAFLRRPDRELAQRYLDLTGRYIRMYEALIGEYPYEKFALIENTWESGYGMPSFTLLGPRVIRLPFIPYTSYPHEILHNWWGNSVYVDYDTGNWSEGLTAYLADHRLKAQRGEGPQYRRDALQKYLSFVSTEKDFPLTAFRARHDEATQAVGYNKSLMMFHMLQRRMGEKAFFKALGTFYRDNRFKVASFSDLRRAFEAVSGESLVSFFDQWVTRAGAPVLELDGVELVPRGDAFVVRASLLQSQPGGTYQLDVPVRVTYESGTSDHRLEVRARSMQLELELDREPVSLTVDPDFDLFRRLAPEEVPPSLGAAFGAEVLTFVVPEKASGAERSAYRAFIATWRQPGREVRVITDRSPWPDDGAVWLLGWDVVGRERVARALPSNRADFHPNALELAGEMLTRAGKTLVLAARARTGRPLVWAHLAGTDPAALARRLTHYGRVSYVAFDNDRIVVRGQWPVLDSPLTVRFPANAAPRHSSS